MHANVVTLNRDGIIIYYFAAFPRFFRFVYLLSVGFIQILNKKKCFESVSMLIVKLCKDTHLGHRKKIIKQSVCMVNDRKSSIEKETIESIDRHSLQ